jgi:hypothetical protein
MHTATHTAGPPPHTRTAQPRVGGLTPELAPLASVIERLFTAFESQLALAVVVSTVRRCRRELDTVPEPALPELLERLARQRLHDTLAARPTRTPTPPCQAPT